MPEFDHLEWDDLSDDELRDRLLRRGVGVEVTSGLVAHRDNFETTRTAITELLDGEDPPDEP